MAYLEGEEQPSLRQEIATMPAWLLHAVHQAGGRSLGCSRLQAPVSAVSALVTNGVSVITP